MFTGLTILDGVGGHHLDIFTYTLGDFTNITATAINHYPVGQVFGADGKPTGKTVESPFPDQFTYSGTLNSGVFANGIWRTCYPSTPGRVDSIWVIDGEEGSIKVEGDFSVYIQDPKLYLDGELVDVPKTGLFGSVSAAWEEFTKGDKGTHATIEDAVKLHKLIEAVKLSAKEGRRIDL